MEEKMVIVREGNLNLMVIAALLVKEAHENGRLTSRDIDILGATLGMLLEGAVIEPD